MGVRTEAPRAACQGFSFKDTGDGAGEKGGGKEGVEGPSPRVLLRGPAPLPGALGPLGVGGQLGGEACAHGRVHGVPLGAVRQVPGATGRGREGGGWGGDRKQHAVSSLGYLLQRMMAGGANLTRPNPSNHNNII